MVHTFTSLRHPQEKLAEAEYFLGRLTQAYGIEFQFELNAFLSASRNVTFVIQKAMDKVPEFSKWYAEQQDKMRADPEMVYFRELRNVSEKQGPISYIGGSLPHGGWSYRFVGIYPKEVPIGLRNLDIGAACAIHLKKLANYLLECSQTFPFSSCPGRAFTEEGMESLGYTWDDVESSIGLPPGYTDVDIPAADRLRILSREIQPLDISHIQRVASGDIRFNGEKLTFPTSDGHSLLDNIAANMSEREAMNPPRSAFIDAIAQRIKDSKI